MTKADQNILVGRKFVAKGEELPEGFKLQLRTGDEQPPGRNTLLPANSVRPGEEPGADAEEVGGGDVSSDAALVAGTIQEVKDRVGNDRTLAARALDAETAGENRSTLLAHLSALVDQGEGD